MIETIKNLPFAEIGTALLALLGAASAIAKLTPTKADDKVIQKIFDFVHMLGLSKKEEDFEVKI